MAVYHITLHAYRSWRPDHPRGYVDHTDGLQPPDPELAEARDRVAKFDQVHFDEKIQKLLINAAIETCCRRHWRLHGVGSDQTHIHFAISWNKFEDAGEVMKRLKNALSFVLGRDIGRAAESGSSAAAAAGA